MHMLPSHASCTRAQAALRGGSAQPFMAERWPVGHRATRFAELAAAESRALFLGPLPFEPLFEPYVIVAVALCPPFDEGLSGYGRNKALHAVSGGTFGSCSPCLGQRWHTR